MKDCDVFPAPVWTGCEYDPEIASQEDVSRVVVLAEAGLTVLQARVWAERKNGGQAS